ncbi:hypothetical protein [Nocardia seriolae]|uniref:Membrane protein n=1 Tax=Nocardia seriolae TaxID=37332 RepID=A0ABC9Z2V8_9NOCA|nr:hypothetical protein [Nocardia seriolae]BEK95013.1 hypothetical protein NSER024013_29190 [Nocardia seriolae]GAM49950.1 hypothetical protein NS07_v2contig00130-0004 [Nocardia seriolae]GAP31963.1 membrane protein [Nocardia seriolae]
MRTKGYSGEAADSAAWKHSAGTGSAVTDEHPTLKSEQLERIKLRDTFLNLNIVALGVVTAVGLPGQRGGVWLIVPWITTILGWAYLSNDDKVSAIARHLRLQVSPIDVSGSWETSRKGLLPLRIRWFADVITFTLSFIAPIPAAITLYATSLHTSRPTVIYLVTALEAMATTALAAVYAMSAARRRRE